MLPLRAGEEEIFQLARKQIGNRKVVRTTKKIEIPSIPIWKSESKIFWALEKLNVNWYSAVDGSNRTRSTREKRKVIIELTRAIFLILVSGLTLP